MIRWKFLTFAMCLLMVIAGCSAPLNGPRGNHSTTPTTTMTEGTPDDGTARYGAVRLDVAAYEVRNGTHRMTVSADFKAPLNDSLNPTTFEDAMLCFYDQDGRVLNGTVLGDLETPNDDRTATLSTDTKPAFIVADHPRWGTYGDISIRYIALETDGTYTLEWGARDALGEDFGYPRHTETGRCM